jgi:hypothetical protein
LVAEPEKKRPLGRLGCALEDIRADWKIEETAAKG